MGEDRGGVTKTERPHRRTPTVLATLVLGLVAVWGLFQWVGLEIIRTSRRAVPLEHAAPDERATTDRPAPVSRPRNIILFIADGLGFAHLWRREPRSTASTARASGTG